MQTPAPPKTAEVTMQKGAGRRGVHVPLPRKRSHKLWIGLALSCTLGYWYLNLAPDACDQSLARAQAALQEENARQAREHARAAMALCEDDERARRAKTAHENAQSLRNAQAKARAKPQARPQRQPQKECEHANRQIAEHLRSGRLVSARRTLQRIPQACRQLEETRTLIAQLDRLQATASKATADARAQLAQGAWAQARTSLQVLASVNRESDDLPELRAVLNRAQPVPFGAAR